MNILKNKHFLLHANLVFAVLLLDQLSKFLALKFLTGSQFSLLGFSFVGPIKNYKFILGLSLGADHLLISTILTGIFCLFLFYYILSLVFIPKSLSRLQIGISILFAGFAGNLINKMFNGYVLDFIKWNPLPVYFNLADVFQTVAWVLILWQIVQLRQYIWRKQERRKLFVIVKNQQLQFVAFCVLGVFCLSSFFLLLNYQFLALIEFTDFANIRQVNESFFKYSLLMLVSLCLFITVFFIYLSNKVYGPLYAFEKYIKALLKGEKPQDLKLRKNDQLKHLEDLAQDIKNKLK